jgi:hypothetical protein
MTIKHFVTTAAAALLLATAAHAANTRLPQSVVGKWCFNNEQSTDTRHLYDRLPPSADCAEGFIRIQRADGYNDDAICRYTSVGPSDFLKEGPGWATRTICHAIGEGTGRPSKYGWISREHYQIDPSGSLVVFEHRLRTLGR